MPSRNKFHLSNSTRVGIRFRSPETGLSEIFPAEPGQNEWICPEYWDHSGTQASQNWNAKTGGLNQQLLPIPQLPRLPCPETSLSMHLDSFSIPSAPRPASCIGRVQDVIQILCCRHAKSWLLVDFDNRITKTLQRQQNRWLCHTIIIVKLVGWIASSQQSERWDDFLHRRQAWVLLILNINDSN